MLTCLIKVHKVELIVGSVIEELLPRAQTRDFTVPETPLCDTYIYTYKLMDCVHALICTYINTYMHTYMEAHVFLIQIYRQKLMLPINKHAYMYTYTDIHACLFTYIHTYWYANMYALSHTCLVTHTDYIHSFVNIYIHTHIHTYTSCIYAYIKAYLYTHSIFVCLHSYIYVCRHKYIWTHGYVCMNLYLYTCIQVIHSA